MIVRVNKECLLIFMYYFISNLLFNLYLLIYFLFIVNIK